MSRGKATSKGVLLDAVLSRLGLAISFHRSLVLRYSLEIRGYEISFEVWGHICLGASNEILEWIFINKDERTRESKLEKCYFKFIFFFFVRSRCTRYTVLRYSLFDPRRLVDLSQPGPITANSMGGIARLHKL